MASTSSTGVPPPSSTNAPAVGGGDAQQSKVASSSSNESPGDKEQKKVPIDPLLLASASFGSFRALEFLFEREDAPEPPMKLPTQEFLDKLVGWTEGSSTKRRLTVPYASDDVEQGALQPAPPTATSHEGADDVGEHNSLVQASHDIQDGNDQSSLPAAASRDVHDDIDQSPFPAAASHGVENGDNQAALAEAASREVEVCVGQSDSSVPASHGVGEDGVDESDFPAAASHETEDVVDQAASQSAASRNLEYGVDHVALAATASPEMEVGTGRPDSPVPASQEIEEDVDHPASQNIEDDINLSSSPRTASHEVVEHHALPSVPNLLKGVTPEGDTALHVVASHGDSKDFMESVNIIFRKDEDLLFAVNSKGDTPLHCAARAGKATMVHGLIKLAERGNKSNSLLRMENNRNETALHDAVRVGNGSIVTHLLKADPELAYYPKGGTSPLYLAILLEKDDIARTLHDMSNGNLSYSGPHGQNALHAAILRGRVMTEDLLKWNNMLTTQRDEDGSTPLHFASSLHFRYGVFQPRENYSYIYFLWHSNIFKQVFEANPAPVYQADNKGLFPIHIAASLGAKGTVCTILEKFPSSAGLRDAEGRTFLHVAAEYKNLHIVSFACWTPSLAWILNIQDNDGNTALHIAVKARKIQMFCSLYGNKGVHLSLTNNDGQTPLDLATSLFRPGMYYAMNTDRLIRRALRMAGAKHSGLRWDQIDEKYTNKKTPDDVIKEVEKMKESSQMLGIGSVLIASIAFRATFAIPGRYKADGQTNGVTQALAGRYTFDAFVMATTIAFLCSSTSIICLMFSGTSMVDLGLRRFNFNASLMLMSSAVTSLSAAFALGAYMELATVSHGTAILICSITPLVVLYRDSEVSVKLYILVRPLYRRMGGSRASCWLASNIAGILLQLWPFIIIFGWPGLPLLWNLIKHIKLHHGHSGTT